MTYTKEQIRKSLGDWLLFKVITDNKGMIPDVDNFLAFLEKGVSVKEEQKQIVDAVKFGRVGYVNIVGIPTVPTAILTDDPRVKDAVVIEDPMEGMVCDSCQ